jgi:hypothetical protein
LEDAVSEVGAEPENTGDELDAHRSRILEALQDGASNRESVVSSSMCQLAYDLVHTRHTNLERHK